MNAINRFWLDIIKSSAEKRNYLMVPKSDPADLAKSFAEESGNVVMPKAKPLELAKSFADQVDHVVVSRRKMNKLRRLERCANSIANALAKTVLDENVEKGVDAKEWAEGIPHEIVSWMNWIENGLQKDEVGFRRSFLLERDFHFASDLPANGDVVALDIGCAVRAGLGKTLNGRNITIIAADPLAFAYNTLLDIHRIRRGYSLEWGVAEKTADIFGEQRFDFVLANNSIDHGYDPRLAFEQIARALKQGGVARFSHWENEAEFEGYAGFHQWNLEPQGDMVRVWNRSTETLVDFGHFGCSAEITMVEKPPRNDVKQRAFAVRLVKR